MSDKCKRANLDGAVLTPEALEDIVTLQDDDNNCLNQEIEDLSEIAFWLVLNKINPCEDNELINKFLITIGTVRDTLLKLRVPNTKGGGNHV